MRAVLPILLAVLVSGCATVRPWQREVLSRDDMQFSSARRGRDDHFLRHALESREGAAGGSGEPAGGCGCN